MKKLFDAHIHHLFEMPIQDAIAIFKEEFPVTETAYQTFLSIPCEIGKEGLYLDEMQNIRMLFLKHTFSPTAYAFAGLEHPINDKLFDEEYLSEEYLRQAKEYLSVGFDGIKMLEGYPSLRREMKRPLCHDLYDKFYDFLEENSVPITMHVANPEENWDISKASKDAIELGRVYDSSYPTRRELLDEVFAVMDKHPKLSLALAHFGFMSYDIKDAERFMSYENTVFDITPGGEQLINMSKDFALWGEFFRKYSDRIIYGSDYYAFPKDENWYTCFTRRPNFIREFFETDTEHSYLGTPFVGVDLDREILDKIYFENSMRRLGSPKAIDLSYLKNKAEELLKKPNKHAKYADGDLRYILSNI